MTDRPRFAEFKRRKLESPAILAAYEDAKRRDESEVCVCGTGFTCLAEQHEEEGLV